MDTSNLHLDYFTDSITFAKRIVVGGADPSHSPDFQKMGGEFHYYLGDGRRGWVFSISMEPTLEKYIDTGKVTLTKKKTINVLDMSGSGDKKEEGVCNVCKKSAKLDAAVKSYIRFYTGGLPAKVTGPLMDKDYRNKISIAFANDTFTCVNCLQNESS